MTAPRPRRATAVDAPAIAALVDRAYEKYVKRIGQKPNPMLEDYAAAVATHDVWVIDAPDGAIAAVLVLIPEADVLLLDNVAVDPARQGKGFGKALLAFAEDEARRQGFSALRLYTNENMTENIALYTRYGYRKTGRGKRRGLNVVYMRKKLKS